MGWRAERSASMVTGCGEWRGLQGVIDKENMKEEKMGMMNEWRDSRRKEGSAKVVPYFFFKKPSRVGKLLVVGSFGQVACCFLATKEGRRIAHSGMCDV